MQVLKASRVDEFGVLGWWVLLVMHSHRGMIKGNITGGWKVRWMPMRFFLISVETTGGLFDTQGGTAHQCHIQRAAAYLHF